MMHWSKPTLILSTTLTALLFMPARCAAQAKENTPPAAPVTGAITGRVVNTTGDPLPGASVLAGSMGSARRSQSAKADKNGDFKIEGLPAGVYRVSPFMSGYATAIQFGFNSQAFYRIGDSVTLTLHRGGVITGKVTGPNGPLIALGVFAIRVSDENDKRLPTPVMLRERATDDRGVYRIYGLPPGRYLVLAAKPRVGTIVPSVYDNETPTYFPSSPRGTASEIAVREGEEITADIQYRGEPGHAISGQVSGVVETQDFRASATISLVDVRDRSAVFSTFANSITNFGFAFTGVPAGEYEVFAYQFLQTRDEFRSAPRRVTIRGTDVSGVTLTLTKQAAIEGRLVFETDAKNGCGKRRETAGQETMVFGRRHEPDKKNDGENLAPAEVSTASVNHVSVDVGDASGKFALRNLPPGSYQIDPRAPANGWYLRSISTSQTRNALSRTAPAVSEGITVRAGEKVSGVTVSFTEGAAIVRGRVTPAEGPSLPPLRVYLVPAEKDGATNMLRYFETAAAADGSFTIGNVAPGEYLVVALKPGKEAETGFAIRADSSLRTAVAREADKSRQSVTLKPCERIDKYELRY